MASAVILDPTAKRKRRSKIYGLRTFMDPGCPIDFFGAFRDNIREFLRRCSDAERRTTAGMLTWCTLLVDEMTGVLIPLYTVEECVRRSQRPFCDYCRCSGWSHHFVSRRRYHVIIPADDDWDKPLNPNAILMHSHLLHGLLHCNGFAHLLCINGREGGSKFISGEQFMALWDRLCSSLHVREATVEDSCRKRSTELRLLLGVAYGLPWFGRWDYKFQMGSFGITREIYIRALDQLSFLPLDALVANTAAAGGGWDLGRIVASYRRLRSCDFREPYTQLVTVRDLLRYILDLKRRPVPPPILPPPPPPPRSMMKRAAATERKKRCRDFETVAAELESRWPVRRLRVAAQVIVDALLEHGGMTRQEVRDAARLTIGDTGLLDFVLKSLGNCIVGRHVVRRTSNPTTRVLEFRLEEISAALEKEGEVPDLTPAPALPCPPQFDRDLDLLCQGLMVALPDEARVVLDSKHWIKKWELVDDRDDRLRFLCQWVPTAEEMEELTRPLPQPEVVVVEVHASVGDLRREAERAMRESYCMMEGFRVKGMNGVAGEEWDPVMVGGTESGAVVIVSGEGADMACELRYEGGADTWAVGCSCGARDDDGERMVACDGCDVWHHTRCIGISDGQPVPPLFLCSSCGSAIVGAAASLDPAFNLPW
ncbi:PHD finger protein MALE MEIOCYTE DEATH 1 [Apostasia shenzhenica]|uniref:PHD finger protein MALE MEIOCYTE DEATH 1 n=1 Tax=Apostasia shenzhenica TaxID=1088818 RepID=A0A2I0A359_9ASPA|nr:PHD finger protein MALE MEIOCYTE DEATH 1 [Apostasia shenzhenica]